MRSAGDDIARRVQGPLSARTRTLALHPATIEKTFTDCVMDLEEVIVLDGIDILPDNSGFRVRCHDPHGPLPSIVTKDSGDTFLDIGWALRRVNSLPS